MELHHIGIAVADLDAASAPYLALGYTLEASGAVASQAVEVRMLKSGNSRLELLQATTADSPIGKFMSKHGPGLHHMAFCSSNIDEDLAHLSALGALLIDSATRPGFGGHRVAFIHPKWSGTLVELVEVV
jgi:methylmalonyl-CoA/ethylmalonyl-CoA epimerase